jgi:hypothetical protein
MIGDKIVPDSDEVRALGATVQASSINVRLKERICALA